MAENCREILVTMYLYWHIGQNLIIFHKNIIQFSPFIITARRAMAISTVGFKLLICSIQIFCKKHDP